MSHNFLEPNKAVVALEHTMSGAFTGATRYYIPIGDYFLTSGPSTLLVDYGAGPVPAVLGVDYTHFERGHTRSAALISDIAIGFEWLGPQPNTFTFGWVERRLLLGAPNIAAVRIVAGDVDLTQRWYVDNAFGALSNGVLVPEVSGLVAEVWRLTKHRGGLELKPLPFGTPSGGQRYVPLLRGTPGQTLFDLSLTSGGSNRKNYYRFCYYDATTGARGALSMKAVVNNAAHDDVMGNNGRPRLRSRGCVWIQP